MFSAYMQEVNLNIFRILNLLYLHFCFRPHICIRNSRLRIFGVAPWCDSFRNIILLHAHHTSTTFH
jgi:hypothetical protein